MDVVLPIPLALAYTTDGVSLSRFPNWVSGTTYQTYSYVHDPVAGGGDGHDYVRWRASVGTTTRPSAANTKLWADRDTSRFGDQWVQWYDYGTAQGSIDSYTTTASISLYADWVSGSAVSEGDRVYSPYSERDYEAATDIAGGSNTNTPEVALLSDDQVIAGYWVDLGPANAFRALDGLSNTRTIGASPLEFDVWASGTADTVGLFGLVGVQSVTVEVDNGTSTETIGPVSLQIGTSGRYKSAISISHTSASNPIYAITLTGATGSVVEIGSMIAGADIAAGCTHSGLTSALVTPSISEDAYGNISRGQRWYGKRVIGTVQIPARDGDAVMDVLATAQGDALMIDFGNDVDEVGPLVYGLLVSAQQSITGLTGLDTVDIEIRGYSQ